MSIFYWRLCIGLTFARNEEKLPVLQARIYQLAQAPVVPVQFVPYGDPTIELPMIVTNASEHIELHWRPALGLCANWDKLGSMGRHERTDGQWQRLTPLLPPQNQASFGRPCHPHQRILNGNSRSGRRERPGASCQRSMARCIRSPTASNAGGKPASGHTSWGHCSGERITKGRAAGLVDALPR